MPFEERQGWETSDSKFCGLETDFSDDLRSLLSFNIDNDRFDFLLTPLMNPSYRPSLVDHSSSDTHVLLPFGGSDLALTPLEWTFRIAGKISYWIDLDSEDEILRVDSETTLKYEIAWAKHLSLRACLLPTPKRNSSCANYARCVHQILQGLTETQLWLRIPLMDSDSKDSWELWNSFRLLCDHDCNLSVALEVQSILPSKNALERWLGESVKAAIISTQCFIPTTQRYPLLLKSHRDLITRFFHHSVQVIISGKPVCNLQKDCAKITNGSETHPHKPYLDYLSNLFCKMEPQELREVILRDHLQDNLEAQHYEMMIERDSVKYSQYQRAIAKALEERVPNEKAFELTTVLMVVGAERGGLVRASLQAAEEIGRRI